MKSWRMGIAVLAWVGVVALGGMCRGQEAPVADAGEDQTLTDTEGMGWVFAILDGSGSFDPDGWVDTYSWSTGGVEVATEELAQLELPPGTNWVTLTVTDNDGLTDADMVRIVVVPAAAPEPPVADAGPDQTLTDSSGLGWMAVDFDGTASSDPDGWIASYSWSAGGVVIATGETPRTNLPVGTNWVTLTVTDNDGLTDDDAVQIEIRPPSAGEPPVADAGGDQTLTDTEGLGWMLVTVDGSASSDSDGWIDTYAWSTGGVEIAQGEVAQLELPLGSHDVTLTVTDNDNLTDEDPVRIEILPAATNRPPVLEPIGARSAWIGYELRFSMYATDADGDSVIFTASNLPPGATFLAPQFRWTPAAGQTGVFAGVSFHADDGHGGYDAETISITAREASAGGTTWYVRVDGGTPEQCTGLADAPYPGTGSNQPCAWDHPFRALPPGGTPRIAGGDTLLIGPGSYRMGFGAPETETCSSDYPWDCRLPPIPSGPNPANPTRILGAGWASGCTNKPELWGAERAFSILDLTGSENVEIGCLELTDHSGCVEFHSGGLPCPRDAYPFGDWASRGIYAEDARNVHLHDLDIHGLANEGIQAGRLADWTVEDVRLAGNGWAGWDGDIPDGDVNDGALVFRRFTVEWNGCGESYPAGAPTGCWAQSAGGYGDGLGTGETGGEWVFEDSAFLHNTSDGLDLLYVTRPGASIAIRNTRAEGNAGNQLKTAGPAVIENCIAVGNCGFFEGRPFTYFVDPCRALGNTLSLALGRGDRASVVNSTITGEGDCLVLADARAGCDGTEQIILRNNIFLGRTDFHQPFENTCLTYGEGFPVDPFDLDYSVVSGVKNDPCPVGAHDRCADPQLAGMDLDAFDAAPLSNSPAIDAGMNLPGVGRDLAGRARPLDGDNDGTNRWDIGAVEYVHPLADSDGDSMRDADEIAAGTDATNGAALFVLGPLRTGPALNWPGVAGRLYDIERAPHVTGVWTSVAGATNLPGAGAALGFTNSAPDSSGYYRVRVRRP